MEFLHRFGLIGAEAKRVFRDAENLLNRIINNDALTAHGIVGFYPANSKGDDIIIYSPNGESTEPIATLHGLRQQVVIAVVIT